MPTAGAFRVESMDRAALEGADRVLHEAGFVQRVGMDHHLHIVGIRHRQAAIDHRRGRAPVLVQFQRSRTGAHLFLKCGGQRRIALARERKVHREGIGELDHARDVEGAGRTRRGVGAGPVLPPIIVVTPE